MPVPESVVFRWAMWKWLRGSLHSAVHLLAGCAALAAWSGFASWRWGAMLLVVALAWVVSLALAAVCLAYRPLFPYPALSGILVLLALTLFGGVKYYGAEAFLPLDRYGPAVLFLTPTGWALSFFTWLEPQPDLWLAALLGPLGAVAWFARLALARLRAGYCFVERVVEPVPESAVGTVEGIEAFGEAAGACALGGQTGVTAIEDHLRSGAFWAGPHGLGTGRTERLLWRWLTPRERLLAEVVFPRGCKIDGSWMKLARNFLVTVALVAAAVRFGPAAQAWLGSAGLAITFAHSLGLVLAAGNAFSTMFCSGVSVPVPRRVADRVSRTLPLPLQVLHRAVAVLARVHDGGGRVDRQPIQPAYARRPLGWLQTRLGRVGWALVASGVQVQRRDQRQPISSTPLAWGSCFGDRRRLGIPGPRRRESDRLGSGRFEPAVGDNGRGGRLGPPRLRLVLSPTPVRCHGAAGGLTTDQGAAGRPRGITPRASSVSHWLN